MIVEVTGPIGVGKSTFINKLLQHLNDNGFETGSISNSIDNRCNLLNNIITEQNNHNIKVDFLLIPWSIVFILNNLKFISIFSKALYNVNQKNNIKISIFRSFWRKIGIRQLLLNKRFKKFIIVVDEGLVHSVHNLFVNKVKSMNINLFHEYLNNCPHPDYLVVLQNEEEIIYNNILRRGEYTNRVNNLSELRIFLKEAISLYGKFSIIKERKNTYIYSLDKINLDKAISDFTEKINVKDNT